MEPNSFRNINQDDLRLNYIFIGESESREEILDYNQLEGFVQSFDERKFKVVDFVKAMRYGLFFTHIHIHKKLYKKYEELEKMYKDFLEQPLSYKFESTMDFKLVKKLCKGKYKCYRYFFNMTELHSFLQSVEMKFQCNDTILEAAIIVIILTLLPDAKARKEFLQDLKDNFFSGYAGYGGLQQALAQVADVVK